MLIGASSAKRNVLLRSEEVVRTLSSDCHNMNERLAYSQSLPRSEAVVLDWSVPSIAPNRRRRPADENRPNYSIFSSRQWRP